MIVDRHDHVLFPFALINPVGHPGAVFAPTFLDGYVGFEFALRVAAFLQ